MEQQKTMKFVKKGLQRYLEVKQLQSYFQPTLHTILILNFEEHLCAYLPLLVKWFSGEKVIFREEQQALTTSTLVEKTQDICVIGINLCESTPADFQRLIELAIRNCNASAKSLQPYVILDFCHASQRRPKLESYMNRIKLSKLGSIELRESIRQSTFQNIQIPYNTQTSCPFLSQLRQSQNQVSLKNDQNSPQVNRNRQNFISRNDKVIVEMIKPVQTIIEDFQKNKLRTLQDYFMEITQIFNQQFQHFRIVKEISNVRKLKNGENLSHYQFYLKIENLYRQLINNKNNSNDLSVVKQFFEGTAQALQNILKLPSNNVMREIVLFVTFLLEENQNNQNILSSSRIRSNFTIVSVKQIWTEMFQKKSIFQRFLQEEIQSDKNQKSQKTIQIMQNLFNANQYDKDRLEKVKKIIAKLKVNVQTQTAKKIIKKGDCSHSQLLSELQKLFLYSMNQSYSAIVNKKQQLKFIALNLQKNCYPQLALKIFKYLQFVQKVQSCVKDIQQFNIMREQQKIVLYCDLSKYYRKLQWHELSRQYAQLAKEIDSQINYTLSRNGDVKFQLNDEDFPNSDFFQCVVQQFQSLKEIQQNQEQIMGKTQISKLAISIGHENEKPRIFNILSGLQCD